VKLRREEKRMLIFLNMGKKKKKKKKKKKGDLSVVKLGILGYFIEAFYRWFY
jgi:hypothetical protein